MGKTAFSRFRRSSGKRTAHSGAEPKHTTRGADASRWERGTDGFPGEFAPPSRLVVRSALLTQPVPPRFQGAIHMKLRSFPFLAAAFAGAVLASARGAET